MGLSVGTRLGPYEIVAPLGAGGMGEVYRARDTRLDRTVAIKVLNSTLTATPDLKARFEREARTISQLNHPNICVLHDVGHEGNVDFLVMEFLEGESLAERIKNKGALPLAELIKIGCEVAEALDKAHRAGIVHRDLKPGNIMLTKTGAKLLDFGLAKPASMGAAAGSGSAPLLSAAMTMTSPSPQHSPLTQQGSLVGTVQYMSPEQIQGVEADARSDIFAFGAVLYEMATGKRAFEGKSQIKVASAILEDHPPPIATLMRAAPASLDGLIRSCLAKDPDARYASAHDIAIQLRSTGEGVSEVAAASPGAMRNAGWIVAALVAVVMMALAVWLWRSSRPATSAPALAYVPAPAGTRLLAFGFGAGPVAVSPDATKLAFTAIDGQGAIKLWLRRLDSRDATPLQGTENASAPFWSPDSQSIAFFADSKLKMVALSAARVEVLCDVPSSVLGGAWGPDGTILFGNPFGKPLSKIAASGGSPSPWASLSGGDTFQSFPAFLPDGDHFLYISGNAQQQPRIKIGSLSSGAHSVVMENASDPAYAGGFLFYLRDNKVLAQPFSLASGKVSGTAMLVAEASRFSVAGPVLAFQTYSATSRLQWYGAGGEPQSTIGNLAFYLAPTISPDGKQVLTRVRSAESGDWDLWTIPAGGGPSTRLTFGATPAHSVWSPDGKYVAYMSHTNGKVMIARRPADGSGSQEVLFTLGPDVPRGAVVTWSPDGRYLSYDAYSLSRSRLENWILPLFGDRKPFQVAPSSANQYDGNFSPDGHWLAYFSYDSGRSEVYVVPFPGPGGKYQISTNGGWLVRWANKNHLFFLTTGNQLMDADLALGTNSLQIRSIHPLFQLPLLDVSAPLFDVTADGKRIIAVTPADPAANAIGVLLNWQSELKK